MISINLNKYKPFFKVSSKNLVETAIDAYYSYVKCNDFYDLKCPCCNKKGCLKYHKSYDRHLTYYINNQLIDTTIGIATCVCTNCMNNNDKQKYHALLPDFILPYHIYEASTIVDFIYKYLFEELRVKEILERIRITHKLFYDWLKKLNKYLLPASIVLKTAIDKKNIIKRILNYNSSFLSDFYLNYSHPFFLFRLTCVDLCITP